MSRTIHTITAAIIAIMMHKIPQQLPQHSPQQPSQFPNVVSRNVRTYMHVRAWLTVKYVTGFWKS